MVRWVRNYEYFHDLANELHPEIAGMQRDMRTVHDFARDYNCIIHDMRYHEEFECSEEDFLMVTLVHPDAIGSIVQDD